ncbi:porin PorA family protein [Nocardia sp. CA-120079]|uniref:porin PorA family protein n=1 Tax=Nocardia sp. CA-120079 TaxID=3239974 RepID=UPI003D968A1E
MRVTIGIALLVAAALVRFVGVPFACRLPEGFASSQQLIGEYQTLDPATFDLGTPTAVAAKRDTAVEQTDWATAVIRSTTVLDLPSGPLTSEYRYAVDRADYGQSRAPSGARVQDQLGGMVISRPIGAGKDSFKVYNPVLDKTQRMKFTGASEIQGREAYGFSGTATGLVADHQLLVPYQSAIADMAKTGDGTTIPKLLLEMIAPNLPARYSAGLKAVLPELPNEVPIGFTIDDTTSMTLDKQLGAPITLAAEQTTILNVFVDLELVPVLPLSKLALHSTDQSAAEAARFMADSGRKLTVFRTYLPIVLASAALTILAIAAAIRSTGRRRAGRSAPDIEIAAADPLLGQPVRAQHELLEPQRR